EYTKLQNAITAGSGAPDVAQLEYYAIPQFSLSDSLLDLAPYGFGDLEGDYTASTWGSVTSGDKVFGLPQDSGPMAMFYNKAVFDQYGITVPTTWDEYYAAAEQLHTADPTKYITSDTGDSGFATSMIWQAGGQPFSADGTDVTIDLADSGSKKWADNWNRLIDGGLLSDIPGWGDEWYKGLGDGTIATLITGAWMPGVLEGSVADASGDWRVAPIPTYDGTPVSAENGGGGQAVIKQSKNPALAAAFLKWLNNDPESIKIFLEKGGFPSTTAELGSDDFLAEAPDYFGGQKINEVLTAAAKDVPTGWQYLPFQVYANSIFGDTVGQAYANQGDLNEGLAEWQKQLVDYGNGQGFTVNK
ncbi:MAG: sugar ABC transporter substrate-binding protein, partial [Leifsonia sp.]